MVTMPTMKFFVGRGNDISLCEDYLLFLRCNQNSLLPMRDSSHRVIDPILDVGFKLIFGRENVSE